VSRVEYWRRQFAVVLATSLPTDESQDLTSVLMLESAAVSAARAVMALGGTVVAPADAATASMLSWVAAEYAVPPRAEVERRPDPPVVLHLAGERPRSLELLERRGTIALRPADFGPDGRNRLGRPPVTSALLEDSRPLGAIVVSPWAEPILRELEQIRSRDLDVVIVVPRRERAVLAERGFPNRIREVLEEARRLDGDREDREDPERRERPVTPFPFVMQTLVRRWRERQPR
jgi:hypothetical protein